MSVLFPNVPDAPGVPSVLRPGGLLTALQGSAGSADLSLQQAAQAIGLGQTSTANSLLATTSTSVTGALGSASAILSPASDVVQSFSDLQGRVTGAIGLLGSGDVGGAARAVGEGVALAQQAYATVTSLLSPTATSPLAGSGDEVNADSARQWGIYTQGGIFAIPADNIISLDVGLEQRISDYPVENGGFASYNKVEVPYEIRLVMSRGGSVEDRQDFLKAVQDAWQITDLFNVVTPECVYLDVNVVGVRRAAAADRGNGLMTLDVTLRKIRQTAKLAFSSTADPASAGQVNDGSVQTDSGDDVQQYEGVSI